MAYVQSALQIYNKKTKQKIFGEPKLPASASATLQNVDIQ